MNKIIAFIVVIAAGAAAVLYFGHSTPAAQVPAGWTGFSKQEYGLSLAYPKDYSFREEADAGFFNELGIYDAIINVPQDYQRGTDFEVGRVDVLVSTTTANCYTESPSGRILSATKTINGTDFKYDPNQPLADDAMGGQRGMYSLFAAAKNGFCYRIEKEVGFRDLRGFADPPYPPHFDETKANADLDAIVGTITIR
ncbi:MAG TPA: hypothetical protein VFT82_04220 [Candidatus Paceibacterota bacterium]|nr:hypothetical protein [Candidatus Paceibacterota bacterium]